MKLKRTLRSITALIVRCCDPEAILLFGSYAKGQDNLDSDLDILVIGDFRMSPYLREYELRELLRRYPIHIDLHLVTSQEVAIESCISYSFLNSALKNSVLLHKKRGIDK